MKRIRVLTPFRVGSVSDPKPMIPGAEMDCEREDLIAEWVKLEWVEVV